MAFNTQTKVENVTDDVLRVRVEAAPTSAEGANPITYYITESPSASNSVDASITGDILLLQLSIAGHATAVTWGHIEVGSATNRTYGIWSCGVNSSTNISLNIPVTGLTGDSLSIIVDSGSNYPQAILLTYIES